VAELKALVAVYRAALGGHDGDGIEERVRVQIHLLMSRDRGGAEAVEDHRPAGGWAARSEQGAVVDEVPGTHITMVAPPHVAVLAERLAGILSAADGSAAVPAEPASQH
jgi:thioesterase domain-containing protein